MIDEQNPNEDDIRKLDLLGRIDSFRGLIEGAKQDFNYRIDTIKPPLINDVNKLIADGLAAMDKRGKEQEVFLNSFREEMQELLTREDSILNKKLDDHTTTLDKKLNVIAEGLDATVKSKSSDYFAEVIITSKKMANDMVVYANEISEQIKKFQTDTKISAGLLDSKFENIMSRFRSIFKDL